MIFSIENYPFLCKNYHFYVFHTKLSSSRQLYTFGDFIHLLYNVLNVSLNKSPNSFFSKIFDKKFGLYYKPHYLCHEIKSGIARPLFFQNKMVYKINQMSNPLKFSQNGRKRTH